jgi:hypothetical protein
VRNVGVNHLEKSENRGRGAGSICAVDKGIGLRVGIRIIERDAAVADGDLHGTVELEGGEVVTDEVEVVVDGVAAGGVGKVGLDAGGAQFDDAAGLLVEADAELVVGQCRAGSSRFGFGRGLAFLYDGIAAAGERRQVANEYGQFAAGQTLCGKGPACLV